MPLSFIFPAIVSKFKNQLEVQSIYFPFQENHHMRVK